MSYRCLADFLEELGHAGELVRVETEVRATLEAAEITDRICKTGGAALLFGRINDRKIPLLTNLLGTEARVCLALDVASLEEMADRIHGLANPVQPEGWFEKIKTSPHMAALANLPPRRVKSGACQQVVRLQSDVDLGVLPVLQSAPDEPGPTITAAALFAADPHTHQQVAGRYDLQVLGADRLVTRWAPHDEPARLLAEYRRRNEKMPLAAVLGGDPAVLLAAAAPVPSEVDPCALAGLLREKPLDLVPCRSVDLQVPAEAEIVIEGHVDPSQPEAESGSVCMPSGHYSVPRSAPVMHVTAITHRANPVYPAMVPGRPPHEGSVIDHALSRIFLPLVKMAIPELVDYDLPTFGVGRHWATLSIQKTYAGQSRRVAHAAWGLRQLMFAKWLVVVDEDIDAHDIQQVLTAMATNVDPGRDVFTQQGPPDPLDVAASPNALGHRMAIDATAKLPGEHPTAWPQPAVMSEHIRELVSQRWTEYGLGPEPD